jgi:peptidoglycan/LPS O-acetylase OafA/YrhL
MRNKRLDILRCIAVLLVMLNHSERWPQVTRNFWIGVDLFFVLSGFLISGLLFSEYKKHNSIGFRRFFIRRGLKIYPAFYLFLLFTWAISGWVLHDRARAGRYLAETVFVQNYWQGVWDHTWSLAVEEHFYILLPILLLFLVRRSPGRRDPFRSLPWIFAGVAAGCLALRAVSVCFGAPNYHMAYVATHDRMDALFCGVLLGYLYHFRPEVLDRATRPAWNRVAIAVCSAALISPVFLFSRDSRFFSTVGFTCLYLGFGGILLLSLRDPAILRGAIGRFSKGIGTAFAAVGMYSYSIYLWHGPGNAWFPGLLKRILHVSFSPNERFAVYMIGSLAIGIAMSKIVEYPVLRLRDRIFPAREGVVVRPSENRSEQALVVSSDPGPAV